MHRLTKILLCCDPTTDLKPSPDNVPLVWAGQIQPADLQLTSLSLLKKPLQVKEEEQKKKRKKLGVQLYLHRTIRPVENAFFQALLAASFHAVAHSNHKVDHRHTSAGRNEGSSHAFVESFAYRVGLNKRAKGHRLQWRCLWLHRKQKNNRSGTLSRVAQTD